MPHLIEAGGALSDAGVTVAFRGGLPLTAPDGLRGTACVGSVRYGMDPAAARRAMTTNAARGRGS